MENERQGTTADTPARRTSSLRPLLRTPWSTVILCAAMVVWFESLPSDSKLHDIVIPFHGVRCYFKQYTYILRTPHADGTSSFEIIDENKESWDRLAQVQQDRRNDLVVMSIWPTEVRRSFAFPVVLDHEYEVSYFGTPFLRADADRARDLFLNHLAATGNSGVAQRIQAGTTRWISPKGGALDALGVVLAGGLLVSLGWISRSSAWRQRRRLRHGLCGKCAYDLSGAVVADDGMAKCPECATLNPRASSA